METTLEVPKTAAAADFLPLEGTDYVEFYVGNAKQAAHFYKTAFGFQSLAYAGPETGVRDRASYVIRQNNLTFVLTTPMRTENPIADHIYKHGDGVKVAGLARAGRRLRPGKKRPNAEARVTWSPKRCGTTMVKW